MKYLDKEEEEDLDKEEEEVEVFEFRQKKEEEVEVFETLCFFNFCGISEKKLKYLNKEEVGVFRQRPKKQLKKSWTTKTKKAIERSWSI